MKYRLSIDKSIFINDYNGNISYINNDGKIRIIKSYQCWKNMLSRCYYDKSKKRNPTYADCKVSEEWKSFTNFKKWYDKNYPNYFKNIKFELDKDLIFKGNNIYSAKNCIFIPHKVNSFMTNNKSCNSTGYIGVTFHKETKKFQANIRDFNTHKNIYLGLFKTAEKASKAYIEARNLQAENVKKYMIELMYDKKIVELIK